MKIRKMILAVLMAALVLTLTGCVSSLRPGNIVEKNWDFTETVRDIVGFKGEIRWNTDMPNGTPRKLCDVSKLHSIGWKEKVDLREGIRLEYEWYLSQDKKDLKL